MYLFRRYYGAAQADELDITGPDELDGVEKNLLSRLRSWIFRQQFNHIKAKLRGETTSIKKERKQLQEEQGKLF